MTDTQDICQTCGRTIHAVHRHQLNPFVAIEHRQTKCHACAFLDWFSRKHLCRLPVQSQHRPTKDGQPPKALLEYWVQREKELS